MSVLPQGGRGRLPSDQTPLGTSAAPGATYRPAHRAHQARLALHDGRSGRTMSGLLTCIGRRRRSVRRCQERRRSVVEVVGDLGQERRVHPLPAVEPDVDEVEPDDGVDDVEPDVDGVDDVEPERRSFHWVLGWTVLGGVVPGWGLLAAGRRRAGWSVLAAAGVLVATALLLVLTDPVALGRSLLVDSRRLVAVAVAIAVVTVLWAAVVVLTHLALRRASGQPSSTRALSVLSVTALIAVVALPAGVVGRDALVTRSALGTMFGADPATRVSSPNTPKVSAPDPWAGVSRVNVLLMGGDSGADRTGV